MARRIQCPRSNPVSRGVEVRTMREPPAKMVRPVTERRRGQSPAPVEGQRAQSPDRVAALGAGIKVPCPNPDS